MLYFDQFSALISTLIQFALLLTVLRYRQRFYKDVSKPESIAQKEIPQMGASHPN